MDPSQFCRFLWGDIFFNEVSRKFERSGQNGQLPRSFVHFILEPFYKVISAAISQEKSEVEPLLKKIQVNLTAKEFQLDIKPFVKLVLSKFLGDTKALVDALVTCLPNAREGTKVKVETCYENRSDSRDLTLSLQRCDSKGPLAINVVKLFNNEQMGTFYAFGRIISGTIKTGDQVKILGESYTLEEREDMQL